MLEPPKAPSTYLVIDGYTGWQTALTDGSVIPVDEPNWVLYMQQWDGYLEPGKPYPSNEYKTPVLSAYAGNPCNGSDSDPNNPGPSGLIMAWDPPTETSLPYSAAWKYKYPADPDLTNSIITVTVHPPCRSITAVSLGLKDIYGNIRA